MSEIKPCPFCGNKKIVITSHISKNGNTYAKASCRNCTASVWVCGTDKDKAVETWNSRK